MKKSLLPFLSLFILLSAFTCENESLDYDQESIDSINNSNNSSNNADLVGTWDLVSFNVDMLNSATLPSGDMITEILVSSTSTDYQVTFTNTEFSTTGSYSYDTFIEAGGISQQDNLTLTDVTGSGSYTTDGNEITTEGAFFDFSFEGVDQSAFEDNQTSNYSISADGQTLTFSQNQTTLQSANGFETEIDIVAESIWQKVN